MYNVHVPGRVFPAVAHVELVVYVREAVPDQSVLHMNTAVRSIPSKV